MRIIEINGNTITNVDDFYDEVQRKFCPELEGFGRNLDAFNDVIDGSFIGVEEGEPLKIMWLNSEKSHVVLGYSATMDWLRLLKKSDQPFWNRDEFEKMLDEKIEKLKKDKRPTLYDTVVKIIRDHKNIEFIEA